MELFYNPERMSETEIKETFVAHQWLVDEIISILKHQPKSAGIQHVVIVAPRGMGKTTLLLMLRFTLLNQNIAKRWQPILFPEESYSVYDLADLWVEVLDHIATETRDVVLHDEVEKLKNTHPNSSELEAIALANIKDWRDKNKKRLLLLVDNFDMILDQIGNEKDNASLRDVLMNDGTMMLVGGSTTFFKEARAYNQPLYNLFKIYNLNGLDSEQIEDLLRRRAKIDGLENFEEILRANRSRLRVLEYFTGGNPRLALMLYRVITHSEISEVRRGLEKLLDEVTPYYKAKIETLPPQQRKILDQIARISAQTREGLTPTEIATATRLAVNQVSSQLKRLADVGYVKAANIRGRSSYYTLSEPLYAIWHQMRFGRDARTRMNWLVSFLKGWYDSKELGVECRRLQAVFRRHLKAGRENDARNALEHRRYLMEAIEDPSSRIRTLESIVLNYLEISDTDTLKREVLAEADTNFFSEKTRQRLVAAGLLTNRQIQNKRTTVSALSKAGDLMDLAQAALRKGDIERAIESLTELESLLVDRSVELVFIQALKALIQLDMDRCLEKIEDVLHAEPDLAIAWLMKAMAFQFSLKPEEEIKALRRKIELDPDAASWYQLGKALSKLDRDEEALSAFDKALQVQPQSFDAFYGKSLSLAKLSRENDAISSIDQAITLRPDFAETWHVRGELLADTGELEEAIGSMNKAIALKPDSYTFLFAKAWCLGESGKTDEALEAIDQLLKLNPNSSDSYFLRGLLVISSDFDKGLMNIERAFAMSSSSERTVVDTAAARLLKIFLSVMNEKLKEVPTDLAVFLSLSRVESEETTWLESASDVLQFMAWAGHLTLARELIVRHSLEQYLFPLARALDYLAQGDQMLIEKLSPEVRKIVDEIVNTLANAPTRYTSPKDRIELTLSRKNGQKQYSITFPTYYIESSG